MAKAIFAAGVLLFLLVPSAAEGKRSPFNGSWELSMDRGGGTPRVCEGVLGLLDSRKGWTGNLRFNVVLYGRYHRLEDVVVHGKHVTFRIEVDEHVLEFDGKLTGKDAIEGECVWRNYGRYPFTAKRIKKEDWEVERFDEGLRFGGDFPKAEPEEVKIIGSSLDRLVRAAERSKSSALLVMKDGKVVAERYFGGRDVPIHTMSVTKFVTAMAVALLVEEGKIPSYDEPLSTWFPEWKEGNRAGVTLRHLLTHTSGIEHTKSAKTLNSQKDRVGWVRGLPVTVDPGTEFSYNNEAVALLSGVISAAAGKPADAYVAKALFRPLGIRKFDWNRDKAGSTVTYAELQLRARDLAKIGLLVANDGKWKEKEILPAKRIEELTTPSKAEPTCGLLWRLARKKGKTVAIYHTGWLGQWLVVVPKENLVGVRLRRYDRSEDPSRECGGFLGMLLDL